MRATRQNKPRKRAVFGLLPRDVLYERPKSWRAFDLAVACAIVAKARLQTADERVGAAWRAGREAIEQERTFAAAHKRQWREVKELRRRGLHAPAPERQHTYGNAEHKSDGMKKTLRRAGRAAHKRMLEAGRRLPPPETVRIELSRFALLRMARLSTDGRNLLALDDSIKLLSKPVWINGQRKSALLRSISSQDGVLQLIVSGLWLEPPFGKVPLPLPTRSTIAASLYLLLQNYRTSAANTRGVNFTELCRRIGIDTSKPAFVCRQAFNRAFDLVNRHVARLNEKYLSRHGIQALAKYEIEKQGDKVRFVAIRRLSKEEQDEIIAEASGYDNAPDNLAPAPTRVRRPRSIEDQARELLGLRPLDD